jgi:hypothetical protein
VIDPAQAERVQMLQLLVRERVIDLRQVDVAGLDLRLAVRHLARASRRHCLAPGTALEAGRVLAPAHAVDPDRGMTSAILGREHRHDAAVGALRGLLARQRVEQRGGIGDVRICGPGIRGSVRAISAGDVSTLFGGPAALVEVAAHLQAGHGERRDAQRTVEHRIEREALDPAVRDHVGRLRMRLHRHGPRDAGPDQHHGGRDREQPVRRHGLDGTLDRAELVRDVLVEDARPFLEVL